MYLFYRIRNIYETSGIDSVEYLISQYVLSHIMNVNDMTVGQIAQNTSISKSAVSKFFKNLVFNGGFAQFKSALYFELQYSLIDDFTLEKNAKDFMNLYNVKDYFQIEEIKKLAKKIHDTDKIVFFGDDSKKSYFNYLINYLIFKKKDVRFVSWCFASMQANGLEILNSSDILIVVDMENSLFNFFLKMKMAIEVYPHLENINTYKYYIGQPSVAGHNFDTIGIQHRINIFSNDVSIELFCATLLVECMHLNK